MTDPEATQTPLYYLTATDAQGRSLTSCSQDGNRWTWGDTMKEDSFLDRSSLIFALDEAREHNYTDVKVQHVLIGDELTREEIDFLYEEERVASRRIAREELIAEKGLSSEEVSLLTEA